MLVPRLCSSLYLYLSGLTAEPVVKWMFGRLARLTHARGSAQASPAFAGARRQKENAARDDRRQPAPSEQ
jgi:hypothetical protein